MDTLIAGLGERRRICIICHWSLVIGHWSLVIGHWSLVISHLSLFISKGQMTNDK
ncbi:hypothetical protein [Nostoc sp.]|uniref:hypothetical protein n=1 Tax=Nostoc sp. TaxID=1180 RepID=UPI002FF63D56